jgi:transcriptional regulator of acetoin/glycerol metabolism
MIIIKMLAQKKVGLRIFNLGMGTQTPTGKLILTVLGGIAPFKREINALLRDPAIHVADVARHYGVSRPTLYKHVGVVLPRQ